MNSVDMQPRSTNGWLATKRNSTMRCRRSQTRSACSSTFSPVFNFEILDATELIGVVAHERDLERTGVYRDEEMVCADHLSMHFERRTDLCIVKGCSVRKIQYFYVPRILIESSLILLSPGRYFDAEQQLRLGDDGDADSVGWRKANVVSPAQRTRNRTSAAATETTFRRGAAGRRGAPGRLRPEVGSRGFLESLSGGNHHRGSVNALDVLDLLGDAPGVIDGVLGKHGAGQHDDTMRRGHTDFNVLADAVGS